MMLRCLPQQPPCLPLPSLLKLMKLMLTQALALATSTLLVVLPSVAPSAIIVERVIIARIFVLINFILTQP